jgi:hypothetical protein
MSPVHLGLRTWSAWIIGLLGAKTDLPYRKQHRYSPSLDEAKAAFNAAYLGWKAVAREMPT